MGLIQVSQADKDKLSSGKVAVIFSAPWCAQCKMSVPIAETVANDCEIPFFKVDCKQDQEIADEYGVMSLPTTILLEDGKEINRIAGGFSADELSGFVV